MLAQLRNAPKTVKERMLLLLSDEQPHTKEELHACLWDELSQLSAIGPRIHELRKDLNERGDDIIVERSALGYRYRLAIGHLLPVGSG